MSKRIPEPARPHNMGSGPPRPNGAREPIRLRLAVFALILVASSPASAQTTVLPDDHGKVEVASRVYRDVARAMGIAEPPPFAIGPLARGMWGAQYRPDAMDIRLDEAVYDLAASRLDSLDVLAYILGHELGHFQREHRIKSSTMDPQLVLTSEQGTVNFEREADVVGLFYGYTAGFETFGAAPGFLDDHAPGPIAWRIQLAYEEAAALAPLGRLFDAGVLLLLIGEHDPAAEAFAHLAWQFPSPEILNNAGVALVMDALGDEDFVYPLELDAATRLSAHGEPAGFGFAGDQRQIRLLERALRYFGEAHGRYPSYGPAALNLAVTHSLLAELGTDPADHRRRAEFHAQTARSIAQAAGDAGGVARARIVVGITRAKAGETTVAEAELRAALDGDPILAEANLRVLQGRDSPRSASASPMAWNRASIGGHTIDEHVTGAGSTESVRIDGTGFTIGTREGDGWEATRICHTGGGGALVVVTTPSYEGEVLGTRIGTSQEELLAGLGDAARIVPARGGMYHVYDIPRAIFRIVDDHVAQALIYATADEVPACS